ncbi:acetyl-CoA carboxylase biotin carboxylase subunit family protein [Caenispirillum salinarum]|uniref:ATP-grasp domain-containing protein n=1 Tax=Caenispirillum salinarum TaxID=859058 RepID=UPI00385000ED
MTTDKTNIFVLGLDPFNERMCETIRNSADYHFHPLLDPAEVAFAETYDVPDLLSKARADLDSFEEPVHGIISWWDFPSTSMLPLLRGERDLPGPSLESVLRCEHKAWSRLIQKEHLPECTPEFDVVNPDEVQDWRDLKVTPPFFLKPVKAHSSFLGFMIHNEEEWKEAIEQIRENIHHFAEPFNYFLERADLPEDIRRIDGRHCVAEDVISGRQATLECFVNDGEAEVYGVIDSINEPNGVSFRAYRYPSELPQGIQDRMIEAAKKWAEVAGLDNTPFNIEFFWDEEKDKLWVLEINSRMSKSHCPLFAMVDGASHQQVAVMLSTGRHPKMPYREGRFPVAAKYMMRVYENAEVTHAPTVDEINALQREFDCYVRMEVEDGQRLDELIDQDSYSYEVGVVFLGGSDFDDVEAKYERLREKLPLKLTPVDEEGA